MKKNKKTAVMTDTNSGITAEMALELGIFVIHMPVIINETTYYEGVTLTEEELVASLLAGNHICTSQPSPGDVMEMWDMILSEGYDELVYIPMSSGLSNSCETSMALSSDYNGRVEIVDNHRISVTLYQSVIQARDMAEKGASAREIKKVLEDDAFNSSIYLAVHSLECLKKGGRITLAAAMIGTILSIKPILTIQGEKIDSFAKIRGTMRKAEEKMISAVKSDIVERFSSFDMNRLHIGAAGAGLSDGERSQWFEMVKNAFPDNDVYYCPLSASISVHTGPGAVGIGISFR